MRCANQQCSADIANGHHFCYMCGYPVPRSISHVGPVNARSVEDEQAIIARFHQHRMERSDARNSTSTSRKRSLSPGAQLVQVAIWAVQRNQTTGLNTRKNSSRRTLSVMTSDPLIEVFGKGKNLLKEVIAEIATSEFENFLVNDSRTIASFPSLGQSSSLKDLKNAIGLTYSKLKFYMMFECASTNSPHTILTLPPCSSLTVSPTQFGCEPNVPESLTIALQIPSTEASQPITTIIQDENGSSGPGDLIQWKAQTIMEMSRTVTILRHSFWNSLQGNLRQTNFSYLKVPKIHFVGESAIDDGGPRREFFRLLMNELVSHSGVFQFVGKAVTFYHNIGFLEAGKYVQAGRLVAWSILHGGPGLHLLADETLIMLRGQTPSLLTWLDFILDPNVLRVTRTILAASEADWADCLNGLADDLEGLGFPLACSWPHGGRNDNVNSILAQHFFYRNTKAFEDFKAGLNSIGNFWDTVEPFPALQAELLGHSCVDLTSDIVKNLLDYSFSEDGSNRLILERETAFSLSLYLQNLEENETPVSLILDNEEPDYGDLDSEFGYKGPITLAVLLSTLTGASRIPPFGFHKKITVNWFDKEPGVQRYPRISTCALNIELPRGCPDDQEFAGYMETAIRGSFHCFGQV